MRVGDLENYLLGSRIREGTSAIGIQGHIEYTSPRIVEYT